MDGAGPTKAEVAEQGLSGIVAYLRPLEMFLCLSIVLHNIETGAKNWEDNQVIFELRCELLCTSWLSSGRAIILWQNLTE